MLELQNSPDFGRVLTPCSCFFNLKNRSGGRGAIFPNIWNNVGKFADARSICVLKSFEIFNREAVELALKILLLRKGFSPYFIEVQGHGAYVYADSV